MSNYILAGVILLEYVLLVHTDGEAIIGPGTWKVHSLSYKEGIVNDVIVDVRQKMLSRTQYGYNGKIITQIPLDNQLGVKLEVCKFVDGGCKLFQVMTDSSLMNFADRFGEGNVRSCLMLMDVDPPELPLPKGEYNVENFILDTDKLPENYTYGHYISEACIMNNMAIPIGCVLCESEFLKSEGNSDEEE